eukprot:4341205-Alexandrium_andersonii.AAC.1
MHPSGVSATKFEAVVKPLGPQICGQGAEHLNKDCDVVAELITDGFADNGQMRVRNVDWGDSG